MLRNGQGPLQQIGPATFHIVTFGRRIVTLAIQFAAIAIVPSAPKVSIDPLRPAPRARAVMDDFY
jgi:hypothetical protein